MRNYFDGWHRCCSLGGKSTRSEFWTFNIVNALLIGLVYLLAINGLIFEVDTSLRLLDSLLNIIIFLIPVPLFAASICVSVRRLRDAGYPGLFILFGLIPGAGLIILLIFYLMPSDD